MQPRWNHAAFLMLVTVGISGCAARLPLIVEAGGTVRINGKPLPNATVTFVPLLDDFGAQANSVAVTDAEGRFQLTCRHNGQRGAVVGQHVVLITEPSPPEKMRRIQDAEVVARYRASLGNRPIPVLYSMMDSSPLRIEVKGGVSVYDLELQR